MAELACIVPPLGQEIHTLHVWTQRNHTCDVLSRLAVARRFQRPYSRLRGVLNLVCRLEFWANIRNRAACQWSSARPAFHQIPFIVQTVLLTITAWPLRPPYRAEALTILRLQATMQTGATTEAPSSRGLGLLGHNSSV